eukprot:TRINITY_DN3214_c0_g2_i2.p2 TRINITY_DN3214_c0_g2~~TRINITY_DN3214_c0_g2_i2.p2  ORF type:complete len:211 (+),score=19.72 TRINITY_DN3214_c0_g2_i2:231-863(+)
MVDAGLLGGIALVLSLGWRSHESLAHPNSQNTGISEALTKLCLDVVGVCWLGWTSAHGLLIVHRFGMELLACVLVTSWIGDTGALLTGKLCRQLGLPTSKLAPLTSPNKTVAGAWGHVASSVCTTLCADWYTGLFSHSKLHAVLIGGIVSIACIVGDLLESLVKRAADTKDTSNIFPGHGGFLDRLDGLVVACPMVYYALRLLELFQTKT